MLLTNKNLFCLKNPNLPRVLAEEVVWKYHSHHQVKLVKNINRVKHALQALSTVWPARRKKYGIWCEKDCKCQNEGFCNANGKCICPKGFKGDLCEVVRMHERTKNRRRRQADCSTIGCPVHPPPENGNIHLEKDSPQAGDAIKYTCKENFTMMGSRTRHCNGNGKWSGEAPTCEKMCSFPATTQHMKVKANPYHLGSPLHDSFGNEVLAELEFSCNPGYSIIGSPRIRCASGVWDNEVPFCRLDTSCPDPGLPENGYNTKENVASDTYKPGNQITFGCAPNYTLVGFPTITCMPSGTWNPSMPTCIPNVIPTCTFTCKSNSIQTRLQQLDRPLACNVNGLANLAGNIVMIPEK